MKRALTLFLLMTLFLYTFSQNDLNSNNFKTIAGDGSWCWFSDPRAVAFKGKLDRTYIGWISGKGDIVIAAYDNQTGNMEQKTLQYNFQRDDHDNPSIIIRPNGIIMVFYSQHGGNMYLMVSKNPEDISSWNSPIELSQFGDKICYSNPVQLSSENNRIYLFWRGSDWQPTFSFSDDGGTIWSEARVLIKTIKTKDLQRPYLKVSTDGVKRIDFAFTDGHPLNEAENSIYHIYFQKGSIYQTNGKKICGFNDLPILHSQVNKVYDGTKDKIRAWVWDIANDKNSNPVIVYTQLPKETDHRYHYARWNGKNWLDVELTDAGKWFPQTPEGAIEPEPFYSGGIVLDHKNPSVVYLSKPKNSIFEIEKWTTLNQGKEWNHEAITQNSAASNVRPVVVRNYSASGPKLLWMNIFGYYIHYTNFSTCIKCDLPLENKR